MSENNTVFAVPGVETESEADDLEDHLEAVEGVMGASFDSEDGAVTVRYDADLLAEERISRSIEEAGYDVE